MTIEACVDLPIEYDPRLIEEVVLRGIAAHTLEQEFRRQRDRIYELDDPEERNVDFQELHADWFRRLHFDHPLLQSLGEQPSLAERVRVCRVAIARSRKEEGADLYVDSTSATQEEKSRRMILIKLRATTMLDPEVLLFVLRRELMHVVDMLEPAFGYEPSLPTSESGATYDNLLRKRYSALWKTTVAGRLKARGWAPEGYRQRTLVDFAAAFPLRPGEILPSFALWFDNPNHTHSELVAFVQDPGLGAACCPLCRAPALDLHSQADSLHPEVIGEIRKHHVPWSPLDGLCQQCADLYSSRCQTPTS